MNKHAYLIMAHNQFEILEKLMRLLDNERNDIYIHIDKKSKNFHKEDFTNICQNSHVYWVNRMATYWGDSSLVECELVLIKAMLDNGEEYDYVHLLSGVDLPIKPMSYILHFFDKHPNKQFIAIGNDNNGVKGLYRYYYFMKLRTYNKYLAKILDTVSLFIQKLLQINRLKNTNMYFCKSQQWFSITFDCAKYVYSQRDTIKKLVKFSSCSDEMFLGTIIVNSKYKDQIYHPYPSLDGHMRYIDRIRNEGASPHTITIEDYDTLMNCPFLFARKFDLNKDKEVIDKIYNHFTDFNESQ